MKKYYLLIIMLSCLSCSYGCNNYDSRLDVMRKMQGFDERIILFNTILWNNDSSSTTLSYYRDSAVVYLNRYILDVRELNRIHESCPNIIMTPNQIIDYYTRYQNQFQKALEDGQFILELAMRHPLERAIFMLNDNTYANLGTQLDDYHKKLVKMSKRIALRHKCDLKRLQRAHSINDINDAVINRIIKKEDNYWPVLGLLFDVCNTITPKGDN